MADRYWVGGTGTWDATSTTHWSNTSGGAPGFSVPTAADSVVFDSSSGGGGFVVTVSTATTVYRINQQAFVNITLNANLIVSTVYFKTAGTLTLNTYSFTANSISDTNTATRAIAFGTGTIYVTGTGSVLSMVGTNFTYTGTPSIVLTGTGPVAFSMSSFFASNALNISTATATSLSGTGSVNNLTITSTTPTQGTLVIYGNLEAPNNISLTSGTLALTFGTTSTNSTINTGGYTLNRCSITMTKGTSSTKTLQLLSNLIVNNLTCNSGILDFNGFSITCSGRVYVNASAVNTISFTNVSAGMTINPGSGSGTNVLFDTVGASYFSPNGVDITIAETVVPYPNIFFNGAGANAFGNLTFTGANNYSLIIGNACSFNTVTNSKTSAFTVKLPASNTVTVSNWNMSGTSGNQLTLTSTNSGVTSTLSKASGVVNVSYCSIQDITATGGATFNSLNTNGNTDNGNNTGWIFGPITVSVTGLSAIGSIGIPTVFSGVYANVTGITATSFVGNTVATGISQIYPSGVQGTGYIGTLAPTTVVDVNGIQVNGRVGLVTLNTNNFITPNGVVGSTQLGRIAIWMTIVT